MFDNLIKNTDNIKSTIHFSFVQGPTVEINTPVNTQYRVDFINKKTGELIHSSIINNNCWTKCLYEYFIDWNIKVYQKQDDQFVLVEDYHYNATNKKVYIAIDSKSLGDNLAWVPYVDEFRKKHNCQVITSTFFNHLFENQYSEIEFVKPGDTVNNIYAMYSVGWFYKDNGEINTFKNPIEVKNQEMQKTCSDILGLDFKEVKPKLFRHHVQRKKQIAIALHSTAQAKYWNNPTGWQEVVDWCNNHGYEVLLLSREGDSYMGNYHPTGIKYLNSYDMNNTIKTLYESTAFVGISSGLSWLSWATNIPTVIISGFTEEYTEPESCYHIGAPEGKCRGCFNSHQLDAGDWNWCPVHKGTNRQFECSKTITSDKVIEILKKILVVF
jgi:autotransporter strand-loop-strand O-heptosyltransferase